MSSERTSVQYRPLLFFRTLLGVGVRGVREGNRIISTIGNRKGGKAPFLSRAAETEYRTQLGYGGGAKHRLTQPLISGSMFSPTLAVPRQTIKKGRKKDATSPFHPRFFFLFSARFPPPPPSSFNEVFERTNQGGKGRKEGCLAEGREILQTVRHTI